MNVLVLGKEKTGAMVINVLMTVEGVIEQSNELAGKVAEALAARGPRRRGTG